jgi:hypothetical protein
MEWYGLQQSSGWKPAGKTGYDCLVCGSFVRRRCIADHEQSRTHNELLPLFLERTREQQAQAGPSHLRQSVVDEVRPCLANLLKDFHPRQPREATPPVMTQESESMHFDWDVLNAADYSHQPSWLSQHTADVSHRLLEDLACNNTIFAESDEEEVERDSVGSESSSESKDTPDNRKYFFLRISNTHNTIDIKIGLPRACNRMGVFDVNSPWFPWPDKEVNVYNT